MDIVSELVKLLKWKYVHQILIQIKKILPIMKFKMCKLYIKFDKW